MEETHTFVKQNSLNTFNDRRRTISFDINGFLAQGLIYGGYRNSKFDIQLTPPTAIGIDAASIAKLTVTCRAASLPVANIGVIQVPYFGRKIKTAGDRDFDNWEITVMNDEDFSVRSMFEMWSNALNTLESNHLLSSAAGQLNAGTASTPVGEAYKADCVVTQYGRDETLLRQYNLIGMWPAVISPINLNWADTNSISEFTVQLAYDYWLPLVQSSSKTAGGTNTYDGTQ